MTFRGKCIYLLFVINILSKPQQKIVINKNKITVLWIFLGYIYQMASKIGEYDVSTFYCYPRYFSCEIEWSVMFKTKTNTKKEAK